MHRAARSKISSFYRYCKFLLLRSDSGRFIVVFLGVPPNNSSTVLCSTSRVHAVMRLRVEVRKWKEFANWSED